jgi:hypothetical protein
MAPRLAFQDSQLLANKNNKDLNKSEVGRKYAEYLGSGGTGSQPHTRDNSHDRKRDTLN